MERIVTSTNSGHWIFQRRYKYWGRWHSALIFFPILSPTHSFFLYFQCMYIFSLSSIFFLFVASISSAFRLRHRTRKLAWPCFFDVVSFIPNLPTAIKLRTSLLSILILWRPIFIIVQFVIVLWRELNWVKIPQSEANKSVNRWVILRAKSGVL
jgi:hypothetical protein